MKTRNQPYRQQKKQARLSFQPVASSSPAKDSYSSAVEGRLANVRYQGSKAAHHQTRSATRKSAEALPTPEPSSQPQRHQSLSPSSSSRDSPSTPNTRSKNITHAPIADADESEEDEVVLPSSKRRRVDGNSDIHTPTRESIRLKALRTPRSASVSQRQNGRSTRAAPSSPIRKALSIGSAETSGDEDEIMLTRPTSKPRITRRTVEEDPFVISDDTIDHHEPVRRKNVSLSRAGNTPNNEQDFVVADDDVEYISSDDEQASAQRRKSNSNKGRHRTRQEQDELDEDLKDLRDSEDEPPIAAARTRGGPVTTQRDRNREHLEVLKRRRAGERIPRVVDSESDDEQFGEGDGVELDQITWENPAHLLSSRHHSHTEIEEREPGGQEPTEYEVEGDDDFIVDDESQAFSDHHTGIPLQYTSFASRKPRELFVYLIEWLVKNKIAPAFNRQDELYELSWNKLNDQIKAQAGSRLISSAWNDDFKNTVMARPEIEVHLVSEGDDEFFLNCDACNKTNHPARYEFKFGGHAYHKDTLEPIDEDAEDSEKSDDARDDDEEGKGGHASDKASYDQQGHLLPSTRTTFNLGQYCAANAEMGHKLTHWKFHLNEDLLSYLEEQGVLSAEAIVARERLSKKKREREAENIVDQMKETGIIEEMWRGLQADLEDARFGMEDHYANGGRRNPHRIGKVRINRGDGRIEEWSEGGRMKVVAPSDSEGE